jgi:hypothetical protein
VDLLLTGPFILLLAISLCVEESVQRKARELAPAFILKDADPGIPVLTLVKAEFAKQQ